jgi:hypothetical protein
MEYPSPSPLPVGERDRVRGDSVSGKFGVKERKGEMD